MWTIKKTVLARRGELPIGAPPPDYSLGERSPEIIVKSVNCGLTSDHLNLTNPYAYTFTHAFKRDVDESFLEKYAHALFFARWVLRNRMEASTMTFNVVAEPMPMAPSKPLETNRKVL